MLNMKEFNTKCKNYQANNVRKMIQSYNYSYCRPVHLVEVPGFGLCCFKPFVAGLVVSVVCGLLLPDLLCSAVSESCERSVQPWTELDLADICMLMSPIQSGTENRYGIRATATFLKGPCVPFFMEGLFTVGISKVHCFSMCVGGVGG